MNFHFSKMVKKFSESYSFGDVTKAVVSNIQSNQLEVVNKKQRLVLLGTKSANETMIEQTVSEALDEWDKALTERDEGKGRKAMVEQYVELIEKGG
jgi:hemerythrin-like domain-containing protein